MESQIKKCFNQKSTPKKSEHLIHRPCKISIQTSKDLAEKIPEMNIISVFTGIIFIRYSFISPF